MRIGLALAVCSIAISSALMCGKVSYANSIVADTESGALSLVKDALSSQNQSQDKAIEINYGLGRSSNVLKQQLESKGLESVGIALSGVPANYKDPMVLLQEARDAALCDQIEVSAILYKEALNLLPENEKVKFSLAGAYLKLYQKEEARQLYKEILSQNPQNRAALNNYLSIVRTEMPSQAIEYITELLELQPHNDMFNAQAGMYYAQTGDLALAEHHLMRAVKLNFNNPYYKYNLAVLYDKQGKKRQAYSMYLHLINNHDRTLFFDKLDFIAQRIAENQ